MIVPMRKLYVASRRQDRELLLQHIRRLGVLHLAPVEPLSAVPDEHQRRNLDVLARAIQVLAEVRPAGEPLDMPAMEAAEAVLDIQRRAAEGRHTLNHLYHELEKLDQWGELRLAQIEDLRRSGLDIRFFSVLRDASEKIKAECVADLGPLPGRRRLVGVVNRAGEPVLPDGTLPIPLPSRDVPDIRAEAAEIDARLKQDKMRLRRLAHSLPAMRTEHRRLQRETEYEAALHGGAVYEDVYAIRGWAPAEVTDRVAEELSQAGIPAVVRVFDPAPDEEPPTLVRTPKIFRPIRGMLDLLGTVAGYREYDVSVPFMIALPIFTAILISDGGYGLLLTLAPLLFYRKMSQALGEAFTQLLVVVGAAGLAWGLLCGSFFGVVLYEPIIAVNLSERSRTLLMNISFIMGAIHLSLAQLWQAMRYHPDLRFMGRIGWALFVWGMYGVVRMFVLRAPMGWDTPWPFLLIVGAALAIIFHHPCRSVLRTLGVGLANFPLSMLSTFSDVISYVRLMAVGLASSVLATSFNDLALGMNNTPAMVLVMVFGHGLNLGLVLIAMFAHGVRLNMLEFANNLGMQWTGYPYAPFGKSSAGAD